MTNYVEYLQPELIVNYCKLLVVSVDDQLNNREVKDSLGAIFPFLCDNDRRLIKELDMVDTTDKVHGPIYVPYTFVLDHTREIYRVYNGWWYVGRPTVEELRMDLRALMSRRPDWEYSDNPADTNLSKVNHKPNGHRRVRPSQIARRKVKR